MKISSRELHQDDLGAIHAVRFTPEDSRPDELGIIFNGHNARVSVLPDFSLAYIYAELWGIPVDYIERPRTGSNGEIEDRALRRDYMKWGMISKMARSALLEAMQAEPDFPQFKRFYFGGHSYGTTSGMLEADTMSEEGLHIVRQDYLDPVSTSYSRRKSGPVTARRGSVLTKFMGMVRYGSYWAAEMVSDKRGWKPSVDGLFTDFEPLYGRFMRQTGLKWNPERPPYSMPIDIWHLTQATQPYGLGAMESVMERAIERSEPQEIRLAISAMRQLTDGSSYPSFTRMLAGFDQRYPDQQVVRRGFMDPKFTGFWHNLLIDPQVVVRLLTTPIDDMKKFPQR